MDDFDDYKDYEDDSDDVSVGIGLHDEALRRTITWEEADGSIPEGAHVSSADCPSDYTGAAFIFGDGSIIHLDRHEMRRKGERNG